MSLLYIGPGWPLEKSRDAIGPGWPLAKIRDAINESYSKNNLVLFLKKGPAFDYR